MSAAMDGFKARRQELEDIVYSDEIDKMIKDDSEIDYSSDDQDLYRNWPIATTSRSKMDVNHLINKVISSNTVTQLVSDKSKSQLKQILEKSLTDLTKSSNKNNKLNKNLIEKVITGHKSTDDDTSKVRDILVYDVPPNLKLMKCEKFQVMIKKITDSMTLAVLWVDCLPHTFLSLIRGLKSFKIVQTAQGEHKLIGYFEKWVDMWNALDNQFVWNQQNLS
ncbi:uncharacterized protein OCT59_013157 [Rhizophagus irregularis]|uniref:uncharacterized protein n=1 Tax=Rhizophagus irregularis TaxID=588596 RepID=UPI003333AA9A|nr:hypothetical protein OCT59_013157 [Rhizophagus irregularis]